MSCRDEAILGVLKAVILNRDRSTCEQVACVREIETAAFEGLGSFGGIEADVHEN